MDVKAIIRPFTLSSVMGALRQSEGLPGITGDGYVLLRESALILTFVSAAP